MRKLFFFDIDGTLTSAKEFGKVYESTREALRRLKENGHFVALATGRALFRAKAFQNEIGLENMVCEGGCCVILNHQHAKIICPSTGECQGQEAGVDGLGSRAGGGTRGLWG